MSDTVLSKPLKLILLLVMVLYADSVFSEEQIIQEEKVSFERCLKIISVSEEKLSITPEIYYLSDNERIASFELLDGILKISCDGKKGIVTVSTKIN